MKTIVLLAMLLTSQALWAGNGVERGLIRLPENIDISFEVKDYLSRVLGKCAQGPETELFNIAKYYSKLDRVDQGIIDEYHTFIIDEVSKKGKVLNRIELEVLDASFSNYRHYDERLSIEKINDQQSACRF